MKQYTLDELIKFCEDQIKMREELNSLFGEEAGAITETIKEYISTLAAIKEELYHLQDLQD